MTDPNLQEDVYEKIQRGLEAARLELNTPLLFGHLCKGNLEKPGALRVSAVVADKTPIAVLNDIPTPCDHDTAFLRHVQRFGREKTLLNWLVYWTRGKMKSHERNDSDVSFTASFLLKDQSALICRETGETSVSVTFNNALLESLASAQLATNYLCILYQSNEEYKNTNESNGHCGRRLDEMALLAAQHRTLSNIKGCQHGSKNSLLALCRNYDADGVGTHTEIAQDVLMLRLLSALQAAFLYAHLFDDTGFSAGGFVCTGRPHSDSFRKKETLLETVPIWVVSSGTNDPESADNHRVVLSESGNKNPIADAVSQLANASCAAPATGQIVCSQTGFTSDSATRLSEIIIKHVANPPFKLWCENAAAWIAHLVSSLQGAKHEGRALEFTFVMGDMAQIEDSAAFERLHLDQAGFEFPPSIAIGNNEEEMLNSLRRAKRTIEKENYFWFQGGRYALLWDFTFPELNPRYLLGLKDSSWNVFIANARNRRPPETAEAAVIVGYLDDRGGGGIVVHGEHELSLSKDGVWIQRGDDLSERIDAYLEAAGSSMFSNDGERETLVKALAAVSNDPDTGCMLVLANDKEIPNFETMGSPWTVKQETSTHQGDAIGYPLVELRDQELVALLGMDGAAVVWNEGSGCRIAFRRLARPDDEDKSRLLAEDVRTRLSGEGSRKWSALLAATRKDVDLIIAVSQDDPVHFYCPAKFAKTVSSEFDETDGDEVVHEEWPKRKWIVGST